jgi:hypothetical protein
MNSRSILNVVFVLVLAGVIVGTFGCGAELAAKPTDALVGTWELTNESSRGTRTSTLVINEDLTGTYESRDREFPVQDLTVEGGQVSFKVPMTFREREFVLEFTGTVEGDTFTGQRSTPRGSREVTGKKVE